MERAELDEIYSMSNTMTRQEQVSKYRNYEKHSLTAYAAALLKYVDINTGKVKSELIRTRTACPLCDSSRFNFLFMKHGFDHMLCNECDMIFTLQVLEPDKTRHLEEGDEGDAYGIQKSEPVVSNLDRKKFSMVFDKIKKFGKIKNIFDFGSATGNFLDWTKEQEYSIIGHEYHTALRDICEGKGHQMRHENLGSIQFDTEFDLITNWDYIDHVLNPVETIRNLTKYLKPGGLFFFAVNNRDSLGTRIMHKDSSVFIGPHHSMHYGINQLKILMKDYELVHAESYVSELNWISNWLNFQNPEYGGSKLMTNLLDPKKICELGMGWKINAIFRKN